VAQGGDWGAVITEFMGVQAAPELLGIHTNMPGIFPIDIDKAIFSGTPAPSGLSADEKLAYEALQIEYQKGIAYGYQMGSGHRRCTELRIPLSVWRHISWITTRAATS
jgi:hypothetical protein